MTIRDYTGAAPALQKLVLQDLPIKEAYKISCLIDRVNPILRFAGQEEAKANGNQEKLAELWAMEAGEVEPVVLTAEQIVLSAADLKCLEPFVRFACLEVST